MKRLIKVDSALLTASSFRGRLKEGLARCRAEAQAYHGCVTTRFLDTEEKECEGEFLALKGCLQL